MKNESHAVKIHTQESYKIMSHININEKRNET